MKTYTLEEMKRAFETGRNFQLTGENNFNELIASLSKVENTIGVEADGKCKKCDGQGKLEETHYTGFIIIDCPICKPPAQIKDGKFEDLFKKHQEFCVKQFPKSTAESSLIGLKREAEEAILELHGINRDYDGKALGLEYADCLMYLLDSIQRAGISLEEFKKSFAEKLSINDKRKWNHNPDGSYSHINS